MADEQDGKPNAGARPEPPQLPMVISPKLDGSDETESCAASEEDAAGAAGESAAAASLSRSLRFALLAASVASAAAVGSFIGSLSASGVARLWPDGTAGGAHTDVAVATTPLPALKAALAELTALKTGLDGATRNANGQFAKLADRLDHLEHAQLDPNGKLAHIAEMLDQLQKKGALASTAPAPAAVAETTGSIGNNKPPAAADAKLAEKILPDWIVQDVRGGHALVESSRGAMFDVAAGSVIPSLGRVEAIKRQDGQWLVVTARGLISSAP